MMRLTTALLALAIYVVPAAAQSSTRRATMVGGGGDRGKCTIEVEVDGVAEVQVMGVQGRLHTLSGSTALWRRFECNGQLPRNPVDFRFRGIDGRGNVNLVGDPRQNGAAVVRIEDPKGGREGYTFDLEWSGGSGYNDGGFGRGNGGGYNDGGFGNGGGGFGRNDDRRNNGRLNRDDDFYNGNGNGIGNGRNSMSRNEAVRVCRDAITDRISRDGFTRVNIISASVDDNPGRNDYVIGRAVARERGSSIEFDFNCNMNLNNGRVRNVELNRR